MIRENEKESSEMKMKLVRKKKKKEGSRMLFYNTAWQKEKEK